MKRVNHILPAAVVLVAALISFQTANTKIAQPPAGNTGGPATLPTPNITCAQCHSGAALQPAANKVDISFTAAGITTPVSAFSYQPGTTYSVSFVPSVVTKRYGFQLSALNASNQNAGSFTITDNVHTSLIILQINYIAHKNATGFKNWTFDWNAPATNVGDVSFYYSFVAADSSGTESNDTVFAGSATISALPSSLPKNEWEAKIRVFPIPTHDHIQVASEAGGDMQLTLYTLHGETVRTENQTSPAAISTRELPTGVYFLHIETQGHRVMKKILVD